VVKMKKSYRQTLRELFPTTEMLQVAITKHGTKKELAFSLDMKVNAIYDHVMWLKNGRNSVMDRKARDIEPDALTMDATIRAMGQAEGRSNAVKVYRIGEGFAIGQTGYGGLEFVAEVEGRTWSEARHLVNRRMVRKMVEV